MPRRKVYTTGERVNIWIPKRYRKSWDELENKSAFVQLCLDDMIGIMMWAILKKEDPEKYHRKTDDNPPPHLTENFNKAYPLDPMTKKRMQKGKKQTWPQTPSPNRQELW